MASSLPMRSSSAVVFLAAVTSLVACHGIAPEAKRVAEKNYPSVRTLALKLYAKCRDKKLVPEQSPVAGTQFAKRPGVLEVQVVCPKLVAGMPAVTLPPVHANKWKVINRTSRNYDLGKPTNPEVGRRYARVPSLLVPQKDSVDVCLDGKALPGKEPFSVCVAYAIKK